ncbi:MliC family protein [Marinobacter segnicrescens]|uniref:Membrane-bound inhibitor of C-type lysozyme n=1 Tax=Marinobacter segnicrescens TaxID=430453 RepID=A0A1I0FM53_9GAMM|nr:MliC family protein [Marinobacter segnicrescens]SET59135.1 Membrane-bound inhibitor of C-type lysozyme [Marinobacter segnicrescens]
MPVRFRHSIFLTSLILAGCASSTAPEPPANAQSTTDSRALPWPMETLRYTCEDGVELQVAYYQPAEGDDLAAMLHDGTLHLLRPWPAASGSRYISFDEQVGLRWHIKGREGILQRLAPDHTAEVETLLDNCIGRPGP